MKLPRLFLLLSQNAGCVIFAEGRAETYRTKFVKIPIKYTPDLLAKAQAMCSSSE
jgi:hypothetical protein